MKMIIVYCIVCAAPAMLWSQSRLDSPEMEQRLTAEEFSDVVKVVWNEMKRGIDTYRVEAKSKNEFETRAAFEARLRRQQEELVRELKTFVAQKKLTERRFAVMMKADLVHYDADAQAYSVKSKTQILIPPTNPQLLVLCPSNTYLRTQEITQKAYKFAYILFKPGATVTWHVNSSMAQQAKGNEGAMYFKVLFRFDISRISVGEQSTMQIIPEQLALINSQNNTVYWKEHAVR
jgi:hypothetical protein